MFARVCPVSGTAGDFGYEHIEETFPEACEQFERHVGFPERRRIERIKSARWRTRRRFAKRHGTVVSCQMAMDRAALI